MSRRRPLAVLVSNRYIPADCFGLVPVIGWDPGAVDY